MEQDSDDNPQVEQEGTVHTHPIPAGELSRYSVYGDPHAEQDIRNYVEGQAREAVHHVERVKQEVVLGRLYEIWDVTSETGRWWVVTNLTNLYSQKHFPSLDYTLSFQQAEMFLLDRCAVKPVGTLSGLIGGVMGFRWRCAGPGIASGCCRGCGVSRRCGAGVGRRSRPWILCSVTHSLGPLYLRPATAWPWK